jgi:hypothetical protein
MFDRHHYVETDTLEDIATGLGWFSIGLGLAELIAPRTLTRALGMEDEAEIVRAYGLREIAAGVGLLTQKDPTPWLWGRVAGDVLDIATLAIGLDRRNPQRNKVGMALAAVVGVTLIDIATAKALGDRRHRGGWWTGTMERLGIAGAAHRLRDVAETAYDRGRSLAGDARHYAADAWDSGRHGAEEAYERSRGAARRGMRRVRDEGEELYDRHGYPVRGRAYLSW